VAGLDLHEVTLVVQDWGGPIGLSVLASDPDRFARVVATNTVLHTCDAALAGALAWASAGHFVQEQNGSELGTIITEFVDTTS
jgi:haloalkane dehalogenase